MNNKKKCELFYLKKFLEFQEINPIDVFPSESPDFILGLPDKKIGIELTEYHSELNKGKGQTRRAMEENWKKLQDQIYEEIRLNEKFVGIKCEIYFKDIFLLPKKRESSDFINELKEYVIKSDGHGITSDSIPAQYKLLNNYVNKVKINKIHNNLYLKWESNLRIGSIGIIEEELLNIINPKIEKSNEYNSKNIDELWLLVVFGYRISQTIPPRLENYVNDFNNLNYKLEHSKLNYVFLYLYMYDVVYKWPGWFKFSKGKF